MKRVIFLVAALASCGAPKLDRAQKIAAHDLADPDTAQFRDAREVGEHCVTGELNAKNRLGAYTGFRPFIVDLRKGEVAITPDKPISGLDSDTSIKRVRVEIFKVDCGIAD